MNHTLGPWHIINSDMVVGPEGQLVADCERTPHCERPAPPTVEAMANAEFIVRACNAHEELLAALRGLVCELESVNVPAPGLIHAKKAIAKAEGKEA